jgi:predicted nucleic acid-binding protein
MNLIEKSVFQGLGQGQQPVDELVQVEMFDEDFAGRRVVFDSAAARAYAEIAAAQRQAGRPIHTCDAQIADITRSHRATLATRNVADFENCGIILINPWT